MEFSEQTFRRAAVGGFNREDVLKYIESSAKTAAARIEALEKENAGLRTAKDALEAELETVRASSETAVREAEEQSALLEEEERRLNRALSEKTGALRQTQEALESERAETQCLQAELDHMREKSGKLESGAAAYAELRDRTGTIELEAHQRAMLIEQAAEEKAGDLLRRAEEEAKGIHAEAVRLVSSVQTGYAGFQGELERVLADARRDLGQIQRALDGLGAQFTARDADAKKLQALCKRPPEHGKFPQPLPLGTEE